MNCFLNNEDTVGKANEMKILINFNKIKFNMRSLFKDFFKNIKRPDLLRDAYTPSEQPQKLYPNGYFTWKYSSNQYLTENVAVNKTHFKYIYIYANNEKG